VRGLGQLVGQGIGFGVGARQLVERVQGRRHRHAGAVGQQVGREVGRQRGDDVVRDGAGSDREAGPGQHRGGHQQGLPGDFGAIGACSVMVEDSLTASTQSISTS
jgi:hypothetical protein